MKITVPKSNCPYIAIPTPGTRAFIIPRKRFVAATKGINITDATIENGESGRVLTITHVSGRVRGRYKFYDLKASRNDINETMQKWAERQRTRKVTPVPQDVPVKFRTAIHRLQRQIDNHYVADAPPTNPMTVSHKLHESFCSMVGEWYADAPKRRIIAAIAGKVLARRITPATGYKMLREAGFAVKTLSELNAYQKSSIGVSATKRARYRRYFVDPASDSNEDTYWKSVWKFCGLHVSVRHCLDDVTEYMERQLKSHADMRREYVASIRERESLQNQLREVMELAKAA